MIDGHLASVFAVTLAVVCAAVAVWRYRLFLYHFVLHDGEIPIVSIAEPQLSSNSKVH
jgi:hypothetical protein